jgi:hypothetical protein
LPLGVLCCWQSMRPLPQHQVEVQLQVCTGKGREGVWVGCDNVVVDKSGCLSWVLFDRLVNACPGSLCTIRLHGQGQGPPAERGSHPCPYFVRTHPVYCPPGDV